jgi:protein phosphatase
MMKVTVGQITDRGLNPKRLTNEDNLLAMPERGLFLVADGVGGRSGGEVASRTVVEVFTKIFNQQHSEDLRKVLESAIDFCNQKIYEESQLNRDLAGMATTIALVAVEGKRAIIAHVGDSRVYRADQKGLICLTQDHSEVSEALRAGVITAEQAAQHPRRNVISRAVGAEAEVEADFREIEIDERTSFLLCSDGITRHISDDEIARLMKSELPPQRICERMKELCYAGGAEDNLTAIVVEFGRRQYAEEQTRPRVPAQAVPAQARAASAPPRQANRIEVDLKSAVRPAEKPKAENRTKPSPQQQLGAKAQPGAQSGTEKAGEPTRVLTRKKSGGALPAEGEMSKVMKMSLLFTALVIGLIVGVLFGGQLMGQVNKLIGRADPYDAKRVTFRPTDPEINAAFARHLDGFSDEARTRINTMLTANPASAEAHFFLGRLDLDQKKYEDAVTHLSQAAKLDPNLPDVWVHLALAYLGLGQTRNATDALQRIIAPSAPTPNTDAPQAGPSPVG